MTLQTALEEDQLYEDNFQGENFIGNAEGNDVYQRSLRAARLEEQVQAHTSMVHAIRHQR